MNRGCEWWDFWNLYVDADRAKPRYVDHYRIGPSDAANVDCRRERLHSRQIHEEWRKKPVVAPKKEGCVSFLLDRPCSCIVGPKPSIQRRATYHRSIQTYGQIPCDCSGNVRWSRYPLSGILRKSCLLSMTIPEGPAKIGKNLYYWPGTYPETIFVSMNQKKATFRRFRFWGKRERGLHHL
jgi:hypothetical protein